ncbi:hypothetical protein [Klebsiella pneumoniae]|uniref:hypothetical protein n=1 Tax=Klebsiella pneumoniae TaxID=573 RepID=UPI000E354BC3|nr:hypothetical protein [Klebsiella pneumoniae]
MKKQNANEAMKLKLILAKALNDVTKMIYIRELKQAWRIPFSTQKLKNSNTHLSKNTFFHLHLFFGAIKSLLKNS